MSKNDVFNTCKNQGKTKKKLILWMEFSFFLLKMAFSQPLFYCVI